MKAKAIEFNQEIENRIEMQIIVDTYDESEAAMGWYCYLQDYGFSFCSQMHQVSQRLTIIAG